LAAESPGIVVYDALGHVRFRIETHDFIDIAPVGDELWVVSPSRLTRFSVKDGRELGSANSALETSGRFLLSSTAPQLPVWHGSEPVLVRGSGAIETPGSGGELILPIAEGRWLLWNAGQLRLWRSIGEAWRKPLGEPGSRAITAQLVLDGRLFVLAQQRARDDMRAQHGAELRLSVAQVSDGAQNTQLRVPNVQQLAFAVRRGLALARSGDRLGVIDLRFGRWIRDLVLPEGVTELAVDEGLQRIALATENGLELVRPDALESPSSIAPVETPVEEEEPKTNGESHAAIEVVEAVETAPEPAPAPEVLEPLPDLPLVRLDPISVTPTATAAEIAQSVDLRLQLVGARAAVAIADGWDTGRISRPDPMRPPFADEVAGLLNLASGRATTDLAGAVARLRATEDMIVASERSRTNRLVPLDVLARDFSLSPIAVEILFAIVAPRLRGELARLYGILANDPGRPLVDEYLVGQMLGAGYTQQIARELDGDRPLRRYALVRTGSGERPFASLTCDPLVARYIANLPAEGEPDQHLKVRTVDRDLEELQIPRALIAKTLRFL
jgi:hypothetical protein